MLPHGGEIKPEVQVGTFFFNKKIFGWFECELCKYSNPLGSNKSLGLETFLMVYPNWLKLE